MEPIDEKSIQWYKEKDIRIINGYGPTETTICSSIYYVDNNSRNSTSTIPIGKPISNVNLYILDKSQNLQPIGLSGELCISGAGLARGYLNNEALTREKFIPHPFKKGQRLYRDR